MKFSNKVYAKKSQNFSEVVITNGDKYDSPDEICGVCSTRMIRIFDAHVIILEITVCFIVSKHASIVSRQKMQHFFLHYPMITKAKHVNTL